MSLKAYNEKRHFDNTPEPKGSKEKSKDILSFVVQKHKASHLHYDFRLEIDGVLKSWAVPKGPSLDPSVKRLAMHVEDHPYSYKDFEGEIPKGNYGAGNVIIWDSGNYMPVSESENLNNEIKKEYKSGSIKFALNGKKLKGKWALFKIEREENSWLLVKEKDEYAAKNDITKEDKSVVSGRRVEEVGSKPDITRLGDLIKSTPVETPPDFLKPMLSTLIKEPFTRKDWIFEIKWDGYRAIADVRKEGVRLHSRNGNSFVRKYPKVINALNQLKFEAVLDGEVVVVDEKGKPDFQALQNYSEKTTGSLVYYIFDLLYLEKHNLMELPLYKRKEILAKIITENDVLKISSHIEEKGEDFFKISKREGLEGIIAKRKDSEYLSGARGRDWLKIKTHSRQEAVIGGFTEPKGGRKLFGALVLGVYKNDKLTYIGHTGGGFNDESIKKVYEKLVALKIDKSPFADDPKTNTPVTWVKPDLVCEVSFSNWTEGGHMRQPIFEGLREDKEPKEVKIEIPRDESKQFSKKQEKEKMEDVTVSNLDKVFWPKEGYTKGDLLNYYKEISEVLLPYLKDRPEVLRRYPNGIDGESFFQKDIKHKLPTFTRTAKVYSESEDKEMNYLICNNLDTLLYMVNLGCVDINPWSSRVESLENPDYLIFDLDPLDVAFDKVVDAAIEIRKVLEKLEIESYPKTSGATGLHIYLPLGAKYTYEQTRQFAEIIVNLVNEKSGGFTSVERLPEKRKGKVYLDFLQNRIGQTLASAYSVRPKPNATVSTPLNWEEVNKSLSPDNFTIKNIFKRLAKNGDLWTPVLKKGINLSKALEKL
jgi:bifunctional non-homologous end joining protein LigD